MRLYQAKIKILLIALFALALSNSPLQAQMDYSVRLGVNGCNVLETSKLLPKYQITAGITTRMRLGKHSAISLSLNYARKAFQYSDLYYLYNAFEQTVYANIAKTSVEVPLLYEFHFNNGLYLGVGPFVDLTTKFSYQGYTNQERSHIDQNQFYSNKTNHLFDGGGSVSIGMNAKNGVGVQLLYTSGWHQFKTSSYYDTYLDLYFKNLALTVSYTFPSNKNSKQDEN